MDMKVTEASERPIGESLYDQHVSPTRNYELGALGYYEVYLTPPGR